MCVLYWTLDICSTHIFLTEVQVAMEKELSAFLMFAGNFKVIVPCYFNPYRAA